MSDGKTSEWKNTYRRWFYKFIIRKYLLDCTSFLDVGCGRGLFLDCVQGGRRIGIDLEVPADAFSFEAHNMNYEDWTEPVDCVFASQFIEHVDPFSFMKWASKTCKKKLVIITPNPTPDFWDDPTHIRPYTKTAIKVLLEKEGFIVMKSMDLWPTHSHITVAKKEGAKNEEVVYV